MSEIDILNCPICGDLMLWHYPSGLCCICDTKCFTDKEYEELREVK